VIGEDVMTHSAIRKVSEPTTAVARPLKVLIPVIARELALGDAAGIEHYCNAGDALLEARDQVAQFKWSAWLSKNFALSKKTAWRYMRAAEKRASGSRVGTDTTLEGLIGEKPSDWSKRRGVHVPVSEFTAHVDTEHLSQNRTIYQDEIELHREMALELIDIGYKAMATRLHPDRGGSKDAMRRLNRVRDELKSVAQNRRFA
jgi:hypothetical protein